MVRWFDRTGEMFTAHHLCVALLLIVNGGMLIWSASVNSPTWDEPNHVFAGLQHWRARGFKANPGNPPLPNMIATLPLSWTNMPLGLSPRGFMNSNGERSLSYIVLCRLACIPFSILGGYVCYVWASNLYGRASGLLALVLWCFCPFVLGHAQLVTCDMAATCAGVTANFFYWRWLHRRTWVSAAIAGLFLGLAQVAKFVWVIAFPMWILLWLAWKALEYKTVDRKSSLQDIGQIGVVFIVCLYVINAAYGFDGSFLPLESYNMSSRWLKPRSIPIDSGASYDSGWVKYVNRIPVPLPKTYLHGADSVAKINETTLNIYLHGANRKGGWWYFYLYGLAAKLSIGLWILIALSCFLFRTKSGSPAYWKNEIAVILPIIGIVAFVTCVTTAQHVRYILPAVPFIFIWVSKLACYLSSKEQVVRTLVGIGVATHIVSGVCVFPHSLAYFNELVGGPARGHSHMVDSNFDWGQDLCYLKSWLDRHPSDNPIHVAYFGNFDPKLVLGQIPMRDLIAEPELLNAGPIPGRYAVSATYLRIGGFRRDLSYLLKCKPVSTAGYSIFIYDLDCETANEFRREYGFPEMECRSRSKD